MAKEVPQTETIYTRDELMAAARQAYGVQPEVVAGAMALKGKKEMTKKEAEAAVKEFLERKV